MRAAPSNMPDLSDIKGQETAKRALEVAAAGGHNLIMVGPPGSGKSMLAARLPSILPPLSAPELLEVSMIHSIAGQLAGGKLSDRRPFRAPHHSASMAAMVGGGLRARPGEVSLAHNGILFLDEFPEFTPQVLDSLRQPLENGESVIARANHRVSYPANIQLIAAMNPCRCGMAGEPGHSCARGPRCQTDYQGRISGPLMDQFAMFDLACRAGGQARRRRPEPAQRCGGKDAVFSPRLPPHSQGGTDAGRSRRRRDRRANSPRRGYLVQDCSGTGVAGGVRLRVDYI